MVRSNRHSSQQNGPRLSADELEDYHTDDVEIVASSGLMYRVKLAGEPGDYWALKSALHPINVERWRSGRESRLAAKARKRPRSPEPRDRNEASSSSKKVSSTF